MALPSWLGKAAKVIGKVLDILILGRQAGLWSKAPKPFMRAQAFAALPEPPTPAYSFLYGLHKALKTFALAVVGVLVVHLSNPVELAAFFGILPATLQKILIPLVIPIAGLIKNWWDHRNDVVQFVVPADDQLAVPRPIAVKGE